MSDFAKKYFIKIVGLQLGTTFLEDSWDKDIIGMQELQNFLEMENVLTLYAIIEEVDLNKRIKFFRTVNEHLLQHVQTTTLSGTPALALYQSLNIYSPLLQQKDQSSLQKQITILQNDLRSAIFTDRPTKLIDQQISDYSSLTVVTSLEHEITYWSTMKPSKRDRLTQSACTFFKDSMSTIAGEFSIIDALSTADVESLLEKSHSVLDDLWRNDPPYPKDRMKHIMDIIASELQKYHCHKLKQYNLWDSEYSEISEALFQEIALGDKWLTSCKQLTEIFWPNYGLNPWKDKVYQPFELTNTVAVLRKILEIRTLHKQLIKLLTSQEKLELKTQDMLQCFKDIDVSVLSGDTNCSLAKAEKQFEYMIQPAEKRIAIKLKKQLATLNHNTRQLIYEYSRYAELMNRPVLRQELILERQFLLVALYDYLKQIQSQTTSENYTIATRYDTPEVVKDIIMIRQLEAKANEAQKVAQKLLQDLQGYDDLNEVISGLIKDLKQQHNELFESWSSEITGYIKSNALSLKETDPVVEFSKEKLMHVNYSPRLVILISEVRQLKAMGYHVPSVIVETSEHAKRFMRFARVLEQIANFHNTIGDRMIPSQKPMMLASALELSKLVQEQEVVSWGQEKAVEKYVELLKTAVEKLSKENNFLTTYHYQISEKINGLLEIDLIRDYNKWKETTKYIRNVMAQVEDKGFRNMHSWKKDLDKQLSQVLEKQYLESLDTLHIYLPEINADLVYRNSVLEYLPTEDNLRRIYDQQLKRFLDIPKNFRTISEDSNNALFEEIILRNESALDNVSKRTDELFQQLKAVLTHWQSWLQLETLDLSKLVTWQHWDLHFRASKTFGQEIAKLPSTEERVGCFVIGLSRLRSDLESHNRSYWDQLVHSLKDSIAQDVVKLQNYVDHSTTNLTKQPVTIDEVGESGVIHSNIMKEKPEMEELFNEMSKKSQILSSWSREQVGAVNRLKGAWDRLQNLLTNYQHIMEKQMETIKTTLKIETENLNKEIERFTAKWEEISPRPHSGHLVNSSFKDLNKHFNTIKDKRKEWLEIRKRSEKLVEDYQKFNLPPQEVSSLKDIGETLGTEEKTWAVFEEFNSEFEGIINEPWIVFRKKIYKLEDFLKNWREKLTQREASVVTTRILQEIHKYEIAAPFLKYIKGEDFTEKHWLDVFNLLGMEHKFLEQLLLKDFLDVWGKIQEHLSEIQTISKKAASEVIIRQALAELDQWDVYSRFVLMVHKDSRNRDVPLIKDFKDILNKIGDNQSLLQSLKNSADYDSSAEKVTMWENKFGDLDHYLTSLAQIQRKWLYLEPIFSSGTLVQEKIRFERIDRDFRHVLTFIEKDLRVAALCRYPNLRSLLETTSDQLLRCQNSLDKFLKEKRDAFPRFLFLNDDDLLEVVGQSSKEQVLQTHLKKIFVGINNVKLSSDGQDIIAMCSLEGEKVLLSNPVNINKPVEIWLNELVKEMQVTLKESLVNCQKEKGAPDPFMYPSQILCLSDSITFTAKCEQAISSMTIPTLLTKYKNQLEHYSSLELHHSQEKGTEGDNVLELKLKALLLDTIHHITVLGELMENNVTKVSEWTWQKQLRYYNNSVGEVTVKMANSRMEYSYEYLGNASKLVQTQLTDKCFLTLTQGIHLGMGGNPYGPAGTGKTESVKALGGLLGRQVLVFNCDEGIDVIAMGRILIGLVKTGAWGCFDEFNRLDEATLSAISMLIHSIQVSIRSSKSTVQLLDQEVKVNKHCGIFVTLNPAGGGYGGRNKLPDNLKQLFRPVVMTHPDNEEISRALLHCEGFRSANQLAKKIVEVFDISSKLLSTQQHYDWGLRSIRTILSGCGRALRATKSNSKQHIDMNSEMALTVQVLRMDTLSKLSFSDSKKFESILEDVFRGIDLKFSKDDLMKTILKECFEEMGLSENERQTNKCMELYEQLQQRMGVAIVGPPKSGKTTIRKLVLKALTKMGKTIKYYSVNPKSLTRAQLLGKMDTDTGQWNDGVITSFSLQVVSENANNWSWIICDGDVDPEWVESLNSVLDDNRLLSLPSGWRIQFGPNVNFIFETHDLSNASPATISRMGIVLLSEQDLDLQNIVTSFVRNLNEEQKPLLEPFVTDYFIKAVNWILKNAEVSLPCSKAAIAETGLSHLKDVTSKAHFTVALINGLGDQLQDDFKEVFIQQIFDWIGETPPPVILRCRYNSERDLIESYYTNPNIITATNEDNVSLVVTGQIEQYLDSLRLWLIENREKDFLLVGPHGSAKTLILEALCHERSNAEIVTIHCSGSLMPNFVVTKIYQYCLQVNTHKGKQLRPKKGHLILHFKNLHLLKSDKWGTNILIEFLNQLIDYKGFFDSNVEFIGIENITIVGSLEATCNLSQRFTSNLRIFTISLPEPEDFSIIIVSYLTAVLKNFSNSFPKAKIVKLSTTLISVYDKIRNSFNTFKNKHYIFTPHDVTKWCQGIVRYKNTSNINVEEFILQIFKYEARDIFYNKLVNVDDRKIFSQILKETFASHWGSISMATEVITDFYVPLEKHSNTCKYSDLMKLNKGDWSQMLESGIIHYGTEGQIMDLVINDELLHLTSSILKTLSYPNGNILLIGKSGVGRKSAVKISAALQTAKLIVPASEHQPFLNNDLKLAMQYAGIDGEEIYFLLEDYIFNEESNMNVLNFLISSGEIPGLYSTAELDSLVKGLKEQADRDNFDGNLTQYYSERIKKNLHTIICLDASNENLWDIIQNCPSLTQNCNIIWESGWSPNTIKSIPQTLLQRRKIIEEDSVQHASSDNFLAVYNAAHSAVCTPSRYISLINLYAKIYAEKNEGIKSKQQKLKAGVSRLTQAELLVKELKEDAIEKQEKLGEKQSKANAALDMISNTMKNANTHKEEMESLKLKTEEENVQLERRKKDIEMELAEVEPLIEEARSAVGNIKSESLSEIRSLRAPPEIIRDILEGVLRLMGTQDTSWNSMKSFLSKRGIKEEIRAFDAKRITKENRQAVEKLLATKGESFDPKSAKRASQAAAPLAAWVAANVKYSYVLDKIKPLEKEQFKLKENLLNAQNQLGELSAGLSDVDATVAKLKEQLSVYTKEAAEIEIDLNRAQSTLAAAEGLVGKLGNEYYRWKKQLQELSQEIEILPKHCLLMAAFMTYMSSESEQKRSEFLTYCAKEICTDMIDLESFFSTETERMQWHSEGLSSDKLSVENAVMILKGGMVPILIDPTSSAISWVKQHLKHRNIESTTQNSPKFKAALELAVRFGKVFIIEEIDTVSPILLQILRKDFIVQGERRLIKINGKVIDYNNEFQLILCSRNEHLKLPAEISPLVNLMNFTVTRSGLTEQLLSHAICQENPELEKRKKKLLKEKEEMEEKLSHLQNQLLEDLANSSGDILQDQKLLESLNNTKASSEAISEALKESNDVQQKLQAEYNVYKDLSEFGSSFYFACNEFAKYNILYLLSVPAFTKLFLKSLQSFQGLDNSFSSQKKHLLNTVYTYMSRGIFQDDRLKFLLYLIFKLYPKEISEDEWRVFLGNSVIGKSVSEDHPPWIPKHCLTHIQNLQVALPEFYKSLKLEEYNLWKNFMTVSDCEKEFPNHCTITEFQKVLIVQSLRPDRSFTVMSQCSLNITGLKSLNPSTFDLITIYKESNSTTPILILAVSGTDPLSEIREIANGLSQEYMEVAMGEGQEYKALEALKIYSESGSWLILKNLHLVTHWLPVLTQTHKNIKPHEQFRLWLISEPTQNFNFVLSQNSLKVVYETSHGIKNNLLRTFSMFGKKYVEKQTPNSAKIFFVIACVHALLQERRKYIPQGWSKYYDFSDTDLSTTVKLVEDLWNSQGPQIQWKFISGLTADAVYGGRIENIDDMKIVYSYTKQYFVDNVISHRWKPFGLDVTVPNVPQFEEYIKLIKQIPATDKPSIFGLAENINRAWEKQTSWKITSELKHFYLQRSIPKKFDQEYFQKGLAPFFSQWKKINKGHEFIRIDSEIQSEKENVIETFIQKEFVYAVELLQTIHKHFMLLNKMCKGVILPDEKSLLTCHSLLKYETPKAWLDIWRGPKEPNEYLKKCMSKTIFLTQWKDGNINNVLQNPTSLTSLFHPEAFIASYKQHFAKSNQIPMDELKLHTSWKPQTNSLILTDLLIEGGIFENGIIKPCLPNTENLCIVPHHCYITWIKKDHVLEDDNNINVPLYSTSTRENKIISIQIPCDKNEREKWLLSGIAFYLTY
ncbi:cytoplasmic dynein 2 heavy chain 1 [Diorhabda sublineata]|uniref:cytoplasmic dynein 2 heavy chain 1 n=1 Tax=Diorhabda sublineata TaxID=1163346 RepID=UPI0024E0C6AE|nr:cytoplasmic dynein 2 heavy chain 1 [Diorhabda sublineata]